MNPNDFTSRAAGRLVKTRQGYWAFIPHPLPPYLDLSGGLLRAYSEAERALGELNGLEVSWMEITNLIRPLMRLEAVLSSRIEGTRASLEDLLIYEGTQLALFETAGDVKEVYNYIRAMETGIRRLEEFPVSLRLFRELHAVLMEGVRGGIWQPGEFRTKQNWIGQPGSTIERERFVPPPQDRLMTCLGDLEKYIHSASGLPALIRMGLVHYQFEVIHPFADGNGRIGRLLLSLLPLAWGLLSRPLFHMSPYFEANRQEYYSRLLAVSQQGSWDGWLTFFLNGVSSSCKGTYALVRNLERAYSELREIIREERNFARLDRALKWIIAKPVFTANELSDALAIPVRSSRRMIDKFIRLGILSEMTGGQRNRVYKAERIFTVIP